MSEEHIDISDEDIQKIELGVRPTKKKRKSTSSEKQKENYVDPQEFLNEIKSFYDTEKVSEAVGLMIYKIANGLSHRPNFINYSFREEMVGDAVVNMLKALNGKKFDPSKGFNPFSYFTCIAFHTFCTRIKKEKKHRDAIEAFQEENYPELMEEGRKAKAAKLNDES